MPLVKIMPTAMMMVAQISPMAVAVCTNAGEPAFNRS
jgi:hypothetical protein